MQLIGKDKLSSLQGISRDIDIWLSAWIAELNHATWMTPIDIQENYPRAVKLDEVAFLFPITSSHYRIKIVFYFKKNLALISEVTINEQ